MGIKDKVINILFDDEDETNAPLKREKSLNNPQTNQKQSLTNTNPIFIDANNTKKTQHIKKEEPNETNNYKNLVKELKQDNEYRMTENISPIFGPQKNDSKNKKGSQKRNDGAIKMYDGLLNAGTSVNNSYSSVIISPIFGPLENKPTRKNPVRTHKKQADPFERNIDDTGEFKTLYSEDTNNQDPEVPDFEPEAPDFDVKDDVTPVDDSLGDTDRLSKISDRINQIKNEASHIYTNEKVSEFESRHEAKPETHNTISDLIHNFQKEDFKPDFDIFKKHEEPVVNNEQIETLDNEKEDIPLDSIVSDDEIKEDININSGEMPETNNSNEDVFSDASSDSKHNTASIDDIFDDDVEDGKDLFSDLFGDE